MDWAAWVAACEAMGDPAGLERAALRYLAGSPAVKGGRGKSLVRWLAEEGWRAWSGAAEPAPAPRPSFDGPPEFMVALHAAKDRDWIASWLGSCGWDGETAAIVCPLNTIAETLKRDLRRLLEDFKISIVVRKVA